MVIGLLALLIAAWPAAAATKAVFAAQPDSPGPINALDREFITVIRTVNLWEIPMGNLAVQRGTTQTIRDVGATLAADHIKLDADLKVLAAKVDVPLPDQPTSSQQSWIKDISSKTGQEFDRTFVDRLRAAHGTVFGLVAEVRAGTRNDTVRAFAQTANNIVMRHMTLLEGTGLVTSHGMFAEASARTLGNPENHLGDRQITLAIVAGGVMLLFTLLVVRVLSSRPTAER